MQPVSAAVLVSGRGSNLKALIDAFARPGEPCRISLVISNVSDAPALALAAGAGIPTHVTRRDGQDAHDLLAKLRAGGTGLVVLAGYLKRVPSAVVAAYSGRMLNMHPALLPSFGGEGMYGRHVHEAVLASGARVTGATVHLVDEEYDRGPILAQWPVAVRPGDTPAALAARVLEVEHRLLPAVVRHCCRCLADGRPIVALASAAAHFRPSDAPAEPGGSLTDS